MGALSRLLAQRIALGVGTLLVVSVLIFLGTEILPGDVAEAILGQAATAEAVANIRAKLNLDQPAYIRYVSWLAGFVQGDLGVSLANGQPIASMIAASSIS